MKHPAHHFIKYLMVKDENIKTPEILKNLEDWGFLTPETVYLDFLKQELKDEPPGFDYTNRAHRPSMNFLRKHGIFEFFHPTDGVRQAWKILSDPLIRLNVEQALLARLDRKAIALRLNKKHGWHLSAEGMGAFHDMFWNVDLLTWDEWGRFLYGRSGMYERYMSMLQATPELAMFHLQLQQAIDSKTMIQRTQEIAYFTIEEVSRKPGTGPDKVKAIGVLGKTIVDCHEALSTSDMALKDILKNFERFRMEHPQIPPPDIKMLAPGGNFTGSGVEEKQTEK
ncbi:MAG: hypothetical protein E6R04_02840 [Spirochaetes bacterium]|nr:MAG: hypothetical protein E6R04_02840 [Spirochaetota bacterium]